jgi:hypothetical protein
MRLRELAQKDIQDISNQMKVDGYLHGFVDVGVVGETGEAEDTTLYKGNQSHIGVY